MRRIAGYVLGLALGGSGALAAQGFGVYEHGTCTMGRAGTAAARPCNDGSAMFFNPAGLAGMSGNTASVGATLIPAGGSFTDDVTTQTWNLDNPLIAVPSLYFTHGFTDKLAAGLGVYVPYGLETRWPTEDFPGRFLAWNAKLQSVYIQPTVGYQLHPRLKVGLGAAYVMSHVELKQRVDLAAQRLPAPGNPTFGQLGIPTGTDFAEAQLEASGNGLAFNFGAILKISETISIGGHYLSKTTIEYDGDATFTQILTNDTLPLGNPINPGTVIPIDNLVAPNFGTGAPLSDGAATTEIVMPPQASLGVAWQASERLALLADFHTVIWGWFSSLNLDFANATTPDISLYEGYRDTYGYRLGAEYEYDEKVTFRGGYLYHTAAAPPETVTPLLPEGSRNEITFGLGMAFTPRLRGDFGYQYIRQQNRRGRVYEPAVGNTGLYKFSGHLLGASFTMTF